MVLVVIRLKAEVETIEVGTVEWRACGGGQDDGGIRND